MIVDSHQHFWDPERGHYPWMTGPLEVIRRRFEPADLAPSLRECDVDLTVLVQTWSSLDETRDFLRLAASTDFVAGVVGWVDLTDPGVDKVIGELRLSEHGALLVGLRHQVHDEEDPGWVLRPDVERGIAAVGKAGLVYDLLVRSRELPAALELVSRHPDMTFVIDHIAKPDIAQGGTAGWADLMEPFGEHANVHCKLSGMVTEAGWSTWRPEDLEPYVRQVLDWFGARRVMFGSDWPVCLLAGSYRRVFDALQYCIRRLPASDRERVMGHNAVEIYHLESRR